MRSLYLFLRILLLSLRSLLRKTRLCSGPSQQWPFPCEAFIFCFACVPCLYPFYVKPTRDTPTRDTVSYAFCVLCAACILSEGKNKSFAYFSRSLAAHTKEKITPRLRKKYAKLLFFPSQGKGHYVSFGRDTTLLKSKILTSLLLLFLRRRLCIPSWYLSWI